MTQPGERRAWGWVAHLRSGGTTPWPDWSEPAERDGPFLPGAQQLELLRLLNQTARGSVPPELSGRVLRASAPGRGRPELTLVGVHSGTAFGPRPVNPADLTADELVRVAITLLADDLVATGVPPAAAPALRRPRRRGYRMLGDPAQADPLRALLTARGRPPGGPHPRIIVMAAAIDRMLAATFAARCFDTGGPSWPEWMAVLAARDQLAPRIDLSRIAAVWARRAGHERITIVLDPRAVPRLVGVRRRLDVPPPLSAEAVELARRVATVLGVLVTPPRRASLLRRVLAPRLQGAPGASLAVPHAQRDWLGDRATRMRDELRQAGYAVAGGDLDGVLPAYSRDGQTEADRPNGVVAVADEDVLGLAIRLLLQAPQPRRGEIA